MFLTSYIRDSIEGIAFTSAPGRDDKSPETPV